MKRVKFYYDAEKLAFKQIVTKNSTKIGYVMLFLLASALFGFLGVFILSNTNFFETPKSKLQARELEMMKLNYNLLNGKIALMDEALAAIEERDNSVYRLYFNSSPISNEERRAGLGGKNRYKDLEDFNTSDLLIGSTKKVDEIMKALAIQSVSLDEITKLAKQKALLLKSIPAIQPVKNEELKQMASGFGYRSDPFTKIRKFHKGMDFSAKSGTPIYATGDGIVKKADGTVSGFGNHLEINHGYGYMTLYAHLSKYKVRAGQKVKRGDIIGYVGSTGRSEASHLHYEVHKNGEVVNPLNFYYGSISAKEYVLITKLANQENQSLD
ncbi:M23 family metallopeptidase [Flavobacterium sp.]|jgi:murein DD-endopeptidase MepM/ murein hydrolase activator NlpD|uniref:M23 family metallopeptidase n=1 Tax=Flavobacterium sp. TaxID=239 RepID=UPI0037BF414B